MYDRANRTATEIAQHSLDVTGEALLARDFERFAQFYDVPYTIATESGIARRDTFDELAAGFYSAADHYHAEAVTRLERHVEAAVFDGADRLRFSHLTQLYRDDTPLRDAYPNVSDMRRINDRWVTVATEHLVSDPDRFSTALLTVGRASSEDDQMAKTIFQDCLDAVTRGYLLSDFDQLRAVIRLPLFLQGNRTRQMLTTMEELEQDFDFYQTEFRSHGVTDIVRLVKSATLASQTRIHGVYRTHILCGVQLFKPSYTSAMTLEKDTDDVWKVRTIMHPLGHWSKNKSFTDQRAQQS